MSDWQTTVRPETGAPSWARSATDIAPKNAQEIWSSMPRGGETGFNPTPSISKADLPDIKMPDFSGMFDGLKLPEGGSNPALGRALFAVGGGLGGGVPMPSMNQGAFAPPSGVGGALFGLGAGLGGQMPMPKMQPAFSASGGFGNLFGGLFG